MSAHSMTASRTRRHVVGFCATSPVVARAALLLELWRKICQICRTLSISSQMVHSVLFLRHLQDIFRPAMSDVTARDTNIVEGWRTGESWCRARYQRRRVLQVPNNLHSLYSSVRMSNTCAKTYSVWKSGDSSAHAPVAVTRHILLAYRYCPR